MEKPHGTTVPSDIDPHKSTAVFMGSGDVMDDSKIDGSGEDSAFNELL